LQPAPLTLGFALFATGRLGAVALMTQITMIGTIEFFAAKALALPGPLIGRTQKFESPLPQASFLQTRQTHLRPNKKNQRTTTKRRKVFCELEEEKSPPLSDFQIGDDSEKEA
jgi:hypothetical protein